MVVAPDRLSDILDRVYERIAQANADGTLHEVLSGLGLQGLVDVEDDFDLGAYDNRYGDILVLGNCQAKKEVLQVIGRDMGYEKCRFRFVAYDEVTNFNFANIRHSDSYAAVMCGPVPHKAAGMGDAASILEELRHEEDGYPPLVELREGGGRGDLCINKQTFRAGLAELERKDAIRPNETL